MRALLAQGLAGPAHTEIRRKRYIEVDKLLDNKANKVTACTAGTAIYFPGAGGFCKNVSWLCSPSWSFFALLLGWWLCSKWVEMNKDIHLFEGCWVVFMVGFSQPLYGLVITLKVCWCYAAKLEFVTPSKITLQTPIKHSMVQFVQFKLKAWIVVRSPNSYNTTM